MTKDYSLGQIAGFPLGAKLSVDGSTEPEVLAALIANSPLPSRDLALGGIDVALDTNGLGATPVTTPLGTVTFGASAHARLGLGLCEKSETLLEQLALANTEDLTLSWDDRTGERYAYLVAGYNVSASLNGQHPIGALGAATFGLDGQQASTFATVTRFRPELGADDLIMQLIEGWRLPATITDAKDLAPGTTVLVEAEGTLGLKLGAQLGYDFSFVRTLEEGGLKGDIGLKVATALSTQLGFSASGKFLLSIERETDAPTLRVRLFKLRKKGWTFALNLTVGATPLTTLPATADDFVQAVFGVHGQQVIADLKNLERWTDPNQSVGELAAGLTDQKMKELIQQTTGIDPAVDFAKARQKFLDGLSAWRALPGRASAWLWQKVSAGLSAADATQLQAGLAALAAPTDDAIQQFIAVQVGKAGFNQTIIGQFIDSLAEEGVLSLLDRAADVRKSAAVVQQLLDGNFLTTLQAKIASALDLAPVTTAVTATDWNALDGWLIARLNSFFGETLQFNQLDGVRTTINSVIKKRDEFYQALHDAATKTYEGNFASSYDGATTRTALLDATFDFDHPPAAAAFSRVITGATWEDLYVMAIPGVTIDRGILTHGLARHTSVQFTLPTCASNYTDVVSSLAKLEVHSEGQELVGAYTLNATDEVRSIGRYQSRLALTAAYSTAVPNDPSLRIHGAIKSTWTYQYRMIQAGASLAYIADVLAPIHEAYFAGSFTAPAESFETWLGDFAAEIRKQLDRGVSQLGDVLLGLDLTLSGELLNAWSVPRDKNAQRLAACAASRAIQRRLRQLLLSSYTQDLSKLQGNEPLYALLVYASLPVVNWVELNNDEITPSLDQPYWDWPDYNLTGGLVFSAVTRDQLRISMTRIYDRLQASGQPNESGKFDERAIDTALKTAYPANADDYRYTSLLASLLFVESEIVAATSRAIGDITSFMNQGVNAPAKKLAALAQFGADLTTTFNRKLKSIYLPSSLRSIGSVLFCDITRALNGDQATDQISRVLLAVTVLRPGAKFQLPDFLNGGQPTSAADIAVEQRLSQPGLRS